VYGTIFSRIGVQADLCPDTVALSAPGRLALHYAGLRDHLLNIVSVLNRNGTGRNDRVAIVLPNGAEMATLSLGVMAGATAAPLNPEYRQAEFEFYLDNLRPKRLIVQAGGKSPALAVARQMDIPVIEISVPEGAAAGLFDMNCDEAPAPAENGGLAEAGDAALVLHTSGTTATPRTVPLSQRNLAASADNLIRSLALGPDDTCLHVLPMFHIGGLIDVLAAPLVSGGSVVCSSGFSTPEFFRSLDRFQPTWSQTVPAMLREIVANAQSHSGIVEANRLRLMRSVSAPLPETLMAEFEAAFNVPVIEIYGMTETAGVIASNPLPDAPRKPGSVGIAAGSDIAIMDEKGGLLPAGRNGEVAVRGDNVMAGYDADPALKALAPCSSWFRTGDQGHLDEDGYLFLTGRIKEIINRGGEKVSPYEIDRVLLTHSDIADAAAFAIPHDALGEEVAVAVVPNEGATLSGRDVADFLRPRLAYFKQPRSIRIVDEIPRTRGGKLQRTMLAGILCAPEQLDERPDNKQTGSAETATTRILSRLWANVLELDQVGIDENFFDLGGDSLKAASVINELEQASGCIIYVSALFDAPTVAAFDAYLRLEYPDLVAALLGQAVSAPKNRDRPPLDDAAISRFRQSVVPASPAIVPPLRKNRPAIFVLSAPRSGSTLLRAMLGGHPKLFAPPELYLLSFNDLAERDAWFSGSQRYLKEGNIRCLMEVYGSSADDEMKRMEDLERQALSTQSYYRLLQDGLGERRLVDKTPFYASHMETLQRAEACFEDVVYIHLLRHPYGMIRSFVEARLDQLWYPRLVSAKAAAQTPWPFDPQQLGELVWLTLHQNILEFLGGVPAHRQYRVTFEDLVGDPGRTTEGLCTFLGLDFAADMLTPQKDGSRRMTDGIHAASRMIGDMKFHRHSKIDAETADLWKREYQDDFLSDTAMGLARTLGYDQTLASAAGRTEFAL
jgi:acyl-CoA synthetase (AMP-forming)/AMP-acid ligase II/acyl carrier protein